MISLANGLVVLGLMLLMRTGLVSFGQGLYYCLGGYAAGMSGHLLGVSDAFALLVLAPGGVDRWSPWRLGLLLARYREIFFAMLIARVLDDPVRPAGARAGARQHRRLQRAASDLRRHRARGRRAAAASSTRSPACSPSRPRSRCIGISVSHAGLSRRRDPRQRDPRRVPRRLGAPRRVREIRHRGGARPAWAARLVALAVGHVDPETRLLDHLGRVRVRRRCSAAPATCSRPSSARCVFEVVRTFA